MTGAVVFIGGVVVIVRILRSAGSPICNGFIKSLLWDDGFDRMLTLLLIGPLFDEDAVRIRDDDDEATISSIATNERRASDSVDKNKFVRH